MRDCSQVERVEVHDTLTVTKTITVQTNDKGDTLRVNTVTDRERIRTKADLTRQKVEVRIVRDTVYIEKRDSVLVQTNTNGTNPTNARASPLTSVLKWVFFIIIALTGMIITAKVCFRKW